MSDETLCLVGGSPTREVNVKSTCSSRFSVPPCLRASVVNLNRLLEKSNEAIGVSWNCRPVVRPHESISGCGASRTLLLSPDEVLLSGGPCGGGSGICLRITAGRASDSVEGSDSIEIYGVRWHDLPAVDGDSLHSERIDRTVEG